MGNKKTKAELQAEAIVLCLPLQDAITHKDLTKAQLIKQISDREKESADIDTKPEEQHPVEEEAGPFEKLSQAYEAVEMPQATHPSKIEFLTLQRNKYQKELKQLQALFDDYKRNSVSMAEHNKLKHNFEIKKGLIKSLSKDLAAAKK